MCVCVCVCVCVLNLAINVAYGVPTRYFFNLTY